MSSDPVFVLTARYFVALLLVAAGVHKVCDPRGIRDALASYRIVPPGYEGPVACAAIGAEIAVGVTLVFASFASLLAAGVFAFYLVTMAVALMRNRGVAQCGCSFHRGANALSGSHVIRTLLLTILALAGSASASGRTLDWVDQIQIAAAVTFLALLYLIVDALLARPATIKARET